MPVAVPVESASFIILLLHLGVLEKEMLILYDLQQHTNEPNIIKITIISSRKVGNPQMYDNPVNRSNMYLGG